MTLCGQESCRFLFPQHVRISVGILKSQSCFFPGGSKPNLADLAVFGVLRPIRNLQTGQDMIASTSIGGWYSRMEDAVGPTSRLEEPLMSPIDHSMKV
jgi:hypothetical protein